MTLTAAATFGGGQLHRLERLHQRLGDDVPGDDGRLEDRDGELLRGGADVGRVRAVDARRHREGEPLEGRPDRRPSLSVIPFRAGRACSRRPAWAGPGRPRATSTSATTEGYVLWTRSDIGKAEPLEDQSERRHRPRRHPPRRAGRACTRPPGSGGPWQATSYQHVSATEGYVLWTRARHREGQPLEDRPEQRRRAPTSQSLTKWASLYSDVRRRRPLGGHQLSSTSSATEGYVLWTRSDTGQAALWKIDPSVGRRLIPIAREPVLVAEHRRAVEGDQLPARQRHRRVPALDAQRHRAGDGLEDRSRARAPASAAPPRSPPGTCMRKPGSGRRGRPPATSSSGRTGQPRLPTSCRRSRCSSPAAEPGRSRSTAVTCGPDCQSVALPFAAREVGAR